MGKSEGRSQIEAAYAVWDAAFNARDAKAVAALYVPEATFLPASHEVIEGPAGVERFYIGILGMRRHHSRPFWLVLNDRSTLHLIHLPDASIADSRCHSFRHFALQVLDLRAVLTVMLDHRVRVFQTDFHGEELDVTSPEADLDFGTGSLFVHDPDGNTIEFLQLGHGIFAAATPLNKHSQVCQLVPDDG